MKKYLSLSAIFFLLLSSCISTKYISIDVYKPAEISFSPDIVYITTVDNVLSYPEDVDDAVIASLNLQMVALDSTRNIFKKSLIERMNHEQYFGEVSIYPHSPRIDENYGQEKPLTFSQIRDISKEEEADALISIDDFTISGKIYQIEDPFSTYVYREMALNLNVKLRVYTADGNEFSQPIVFDDTLYWSERTNEYPFYRELPSMPDVVDETVSIASESLAKQFIPYWETQSRAYFGDIKNANKLVEEGKWDAAAIIWTTAYEKEQKDVRRARLAHNIALAYECMDKIDEAVEWSGKAVELSTTLRTEDYKSQILFYNAALKLRQVSQLKLETQIGSSNGD